MTNYNDKIIRIIKEIIPEGTSIPCVLTDTLLLGKESVYRRIRGEVCFTLEEVVKLANKFQFSLDKALDITRKETSYFSLTLPNSTVKIEGYGDRLSSFISFFKKMKKDPNSMARYASNTLPYSFYFTHENLARFLYFKWLYQSGEDLSHMTVKDILIPKHVLDLQTQFVVETKCLSNSVFILDRNVFSSIKYDIECFYGLHLIDSEDIKLIQNELFSILDDLELMANNGAYNTGAKVEIYLSNIDLEATYSHFEYVDEQCAHLILYGISGVDTESTDVCEKQKIWIDSLKKNSTLISESGKMQRYGYLHSQRNEVHSLSDYFVKCTSSN